MARFQAQTNAVVTRLDLSNEETRRLADVLDYGFDPPPVLSESLRRLSDPERKAPELAWADSTA